MAYFPPRPDNYKYFHEDPDTDCEIPSVSSTPEERRLQSIQRAQQPLPPRVAAVTPIWVRTHELFAPFYKSGNDYDEDDQEQMITFVVRLMQHEHAKMNQTRGNGYRVKYKITPFLDGQSPSLHGLPLLVDVDAVNHLTKTELQRYCEGYGIAPVPRDVEKRRMAVKRHIGCVI